MSTILNPQDSPHEGEIELSPPPGLAALNWARVLQVVQRHGLTGVICMLLAYQLGWIASAQSQVCGV